MLKPMLLAAVVIWLTGCGEKLTKPEPVQLQATKIACPSWKDRAKGHERQLADEIDAAPASAVWPDMLVADQSLKDQVTAEGCPAVKKPAIIKPAGGP